MDTYLRLFYTSETYKLGYVSNAFNSFVPAPSCGVTKMISKVLLFVFLYIIGELGAANIRNATTLNHFCQSPPDGLLSKEWVDKVKNEGPVSGWYLPLFSKKAKNETQEYEWLHTRATVDGRDKRAFCPRIVWTYRKAVLANNDKNVVYRCTEKKLTEYCPLWQNSVEESTDKDSKPDRTTVAFPLTDNKNYALVFRCWEDGYRDWFTISPQKVLSHNIQKTILKEVNRLGFDGNDYVVVNYENCEE